MKLIQAACTATAARLPESDHPGAGRHRVLVADDSQTVRMLLGRHLTRANMEVIEAASGQETLALAKARHPDVVVLDWRMPGGGLPLARALVDRHGLAGRLIMVSGLADPRDRRAALDAGVTTYFLKPAPMDDLIHAVAQVAQANRSG